MKNLLFAYCVLALSILFVTTLNAKELNKEKKNAIVESLSEGISSENYGLRTSSALQLVKLIEDKKLSGIEADKALIPLLKMLSNGNTEEERIAAALALHNIGNAIGIYRLKKAARFDESKRVRDICASLYYDFNKPQINKYYISIR